MNSKIKRLSAKIASGNYSVKDLQNLKREIKMSTINSHNDNDGDDYSVIDDEDESLTGSEHPLNVIGQDEYYKLLDAWEQNSYLACPKCGEPKSLQEVGNAALGLPCDGGTFKKPCNYKGPLIQTRYISYNSPSTCYNCGSNNINTQYPKFGSAYHCLDCGSYGVKG